MLFELKITKAPEGHKHNLHFLFAFSKEEAERILKEINQKMEKLFIQFELYKLIESPVFS
jgi:predicted transcriptional regulator